MCAYVWSFASTQVFHHGVEINSVPHNFTSVSILNVEPEGLFITLTRQRLIDLGFESRYGQGTFLMAKTCRTAVWPTRSLLLNSYRGSLQGVKRLERYADNSPPSNSELDNELTHNFSPKLCLPGVYMHFTFILSRHI